jgi:hypothetical protein
MHSLPQGFQVAVVVLSGLVRRFGMPGEALMLLSDFPVAQ